MKFVRVFQVGGDFRAHEIGRVSFDGQKISVAPQSPVMLSLLKSPVMLPVSGKPHAVTASQPELFLSGLCVQYRSAALKCGAVEESAA